MHRLSSNFVLGYHGCDAEIADELLSGKPFKSSANDYDWLGHGIYFWEANPKRGLDFAKEAMSRKGASAGTPSVIGAVIDLGFCLDMTTLGAIAMVSDAYERLKELSAKADKPLPENSKDLGLRRLDCAVIMALHEIVEQSGEALDTVRGIFIEGEPIYPQAGFYSKTHTQIAVRNLGCIKGVFRVPEE